MKKVFGKVFVHKDYVDSLPPKERQFYEEALRLLPSDFFWNIVNIDKERERVNFSNYKSFDKEEHPELLEYILIDLKKGKIKRKKSSFKNPPILHRKELFVEPDYPLYKKFKRLTEEEEKAGLYKKEIKNKIGFKNFWEELLKNKGLKIENHRVIELEKSKTKKLVQKILFNLEPKIDPSKTAISRKEPSFPAQIAVKKRLIKDPIFDWGCGKGRDIEYFKNLGFEAEGWDPKFKKDAPPENFEAGKFNFVTLIYVLNVIPEREERLEILKSVYKFLPKKGRLFVAVRSKEEIKRVKRPSWKRYKDGWLTLKGTFQKGYVFEDLKKEVSQSNFVKIKKIFTNPLIVLAEK